MSDAKDAIITQAITQIAAERDRQIRQEGWTPEHDLEHSTPRGLVQAALEYTHHATLGLSAYRPAALYKATPAPTGWPFHPHWWKPTNPERDLIKAAALIAAAVDLMHLQEKEAHKAMEALNASH